LQPKLNTTMQLLTLSTDSNAYWAPESVPIV
jgi:hypothetical protein